MRSYLRFDPEFPDRKAHYPDGAGMCFVLTLAFAEQQPHRGYFKPAVLKALLEKRARWIPYLIEHGDLQVLPDGRLYLVGWNEWQEGDWKVQERVKRIRERRAAVTSGVTSGVTSPVTETVNTPSEPLAVGGRRLAVGGHNPTVTEDREPGPPSLPLAPEPEALELQAALSDLIGQIQPKGVDALSANRMWLDFRDRFQGVTEMAAVVAADQERRRSENREPIHSVEGCRLPLRWEYDKRADRGDARTGTRQDSGLSMTDFAAMARTLRVVGKEDS